jgi:hypothetical protein
MSRSVENLQPAPSPAEEVDEAIARVGAMNVSELRSDWQNRFGAAPPPAFSKDLLARAIADRLQEEAYGGLSASTKRLLSAEISSRRSFSRRRSSASPPPCAMMAASGKNSERPCELRPIPEAHHQARHVQAEGQVNHSPPGLGASKQKERRRPCEASPSTHSPEQLH